MRTLITALVALFAVSAFATESKIQPQNPSAIKEVPVQAATKKKAKKHVKKHKAAPAQKAAPAAVQHPAEEAPVSK